MGIEIPKMSNKKIARKLPIAVSQKGRRTTSSRGYHMYKIRGKKAAGGFFCLPNLSLSPS